jgi:hypothetical protein
MFGVEKYKRAKNSDCDVEVTEFMWPRWDIIRVINAMLRKRNYLNSLAALGIY